MRMSFLHYPTPLLLYFVAILAFEGFWLLFIEGFKQIHKCTHWAIHDLAHLLWKRRLYDIRKTFGKTNVLNKLRITKHGRNIFVLESGYAAANPCDIEELFLMQFGEINELGHIRSDGVHTTLHGWYGITLPLYANTIPPLCSKMVHSYACSSASMMAI